MTDFMTQVSQGVYEVMSAFSPSGVDPIYFFGTFFIMYAIGFAILEKVHFLGEERRGVRLIIALVIAYFTASSAISTALLGNLFPNVGIAMLVLLSFLIVAGFLLPDKFRENLPFGGIVTLITLALILIITWETTFHSFSLIGETLSLSNFDPLGFGILLGIAAFGIFIILIAVGSGEKKERKWGDKLADFLLAPYERKK